MKKTLESANEPESLRHMAARNTTPGMHGLPTEPRPRLQPQAGSWSKRCAIHHTQSGWHAGIPLMLSMQHPNSPLALLVVDPGQLLAPVGKAYAKTRARKRDDGITFAVASFMGTPRRSRSTLGIAG